MCSFPDAAEGARAWELCFKNPGHPNFIPVSQFEMSHLPKRYQRDCVLKCVMNVAQCTGRVRVCYTSRGRPDNYAFAAARGSALPHSGTAYVYRVSPASGRCPCPHAEGHDSPKKKWWKVQVQTACHVVFNTEEAKKSKVDLYYDDEKASDDGRMKTIYGLEVMEQNQKGDRCELICATHDAKLIEELQVLFDESRELYHTLSSQLADKNFSRPCVIVSHPHGKYKHITVGKLKGRRKMCGIGRRIFTYDTDTCRGSSGAPIIMPLGIGPVKSPYIAPHSSAEDQNLNKSGEGDVWLL